MKVNNNTKGFIINEGTNTIIAAGEVNGVKTLEIWRQCKASDLQKVFSIIDEEDGRFIDFNEKDHCKLLGIRRVD